MIDTMEWIKGHMISVLGEVGCVRPGPRRI